MQEQYGNQTHILKVQNKIKNTTIVSDTCIYTLISTSNHRAALEEYYNKTIIYWVLFMKISIKLRHKYIKEKHTFFIVQIEIKCRADYLVVFVLICTSVMILHRLYIYHI